MRCDVLRMLCAGLLGLCACAWGYGSGGDFTDAERALFVDAPRMFPVKSLGRYSPYNPIWFDSDRLILNTSNPSLTMPGSRRGVLQHIALLNTKTGIWESTQYQGILSCYADGNIVVNTFPGQEPYATTGSATSKGSLIYWYGRFGEKLQRMPDAAGIPSFSAVSCLPHWFESAQGERLEQGTQFGKDIRHRVMALRKEDGLLRGCFKVCVNGH